jgi:autotransporter-associated beta strand protein
MSLRDTEQEVGNLSAAGTPQWAVLQNYEDKSQDANHGSGQGHLIINQDQDLTYVGYIRNSWTRGTNNSDPLKITKKGTGTLVISTGSKNTGGIDVKEGMLQIGDGNARGALLNSNAVQIDAGATLKYYRTDRQNVEGVIRIGHDISGDGTLIFASNNWNSAGVGVEGAGDYRYTGTNTLSSSANFIIDNARLVVFDQADLGVNEPTVKVINDGQLYLGKGGTYSSPLEIEGQGWSQPSGTRWGALFAYTYTGGGKATYAGNILLTDNARVSALNFGGLDITGVVSSGNNAYGLNFTGNRQITLAGENTYLGNTHVREQRVVVTGGLYRDATKYNALDAASQGIIILGGEGGQAGAARLDFTADNQIGEFSNGAALNPIDVQFESGSSRWNYFTLRGTSQEIGNILAGNYNGRTVIQSFDGPADSSLTKSNDPAVLTVNQTVDQGYGGLVRNVYNGTGDLQPCAIANGGLAAVGALATQVNDARLDVQSTRAGDHTIPLLCGCGVDIECDATGQMNTATIDVACRPSQATNA